MNDVISKNIRKYRELKDYSQEYMAHELNINQASYAKIENNSTKLTVDRLFAISKLLDVDVSELLDLKKQNVFNLYDNHHAVGLQEVENLYQENKEATAKLISNYEDQIKDLKEEIQFLRTKIK